ncbi:hypothetical protein [Azospirillum palustre]
MGGTDHLVCCSHGMGPERRLMTTMQSEVYEAFRSIDVPED